MKKVVFKGIINGKEFDNVKDYNKAMSELLVSGKSVSASSKTEIVDEPEPAKIEDKKEKVKVKEVFNINDYTPFFNSNVKQYYLDAIASPDDDIFEKDLERVREKLESTYAELDRYLKDEEVSIEDAWDLINDIKCIRAQIKSDTEDTESSINQIQERIRKDEERLDSLDRANMVIDVVSTYYENAFDAIKKYLLNA